MEIKFLNCSQYKEWNNFVDQSPQGDVFCYTWWLDAITKSNFKILAVFEKNNIVAGIPLAFDKYSRINEPPLTRTLGVLFKPQVNISEYKKTSCERKWLNAILENILLENFVQMCMHHSFKDWLPFRWKGYSQTIRYTYLIRYSEKIEDLWGNLNRSMKSNILRAEKMKITVEESDDFSLLYQCVCLSYKRQNLKYRNPFEDLNTLDQAIKKNGKRLILTAVDSQKRVHAANYIVYNNKSAYSLLSGSDPEFRKFGSHTLIIWEALKYFHSKVSYFNFGGSDIKRIEEHRRGFGGELTPYYHIYNNHNLHANDVRFQIKEIFAHSFSLIKAISTKLPSVR